MTKNVTVKVAPLREYIKAKLADCLSGGSVTHSNSDPVWSPSQWDVTADRQTRHSLTTSGSVSVEGSTVRVSLSYTVIDIPPRV